MQILVVTNTREKTLEVYVFSNMFLKKSPNLAVTMHLGKY